MKKVSIIIPTFRRPQYIIEAIDSVLAQSYENIEVIVVDDNGKGTEDQICNAMLLFSYIESGKIIYIVHDNNMNGSAARNTGIKNSSGDYICFLDDDDVFLKNKVEKQISYLETTNSLACVCAFERFYENGFSEQHKINTLKINSLDILQLQMDICSGSSLMVSREILDKLEGFDETFNRMQDIEFIYRLSKVTDIVVCDEILLKVRMHKSNESNSVQDGKKYQNTLTHFYNTFSNDIDKLSRIERKKTIYIYNYLILKCYLKNKNLKSSFKWLFKTKRPIYSIFRIFNDFNRYRKLSKRRRS